MADEKEQQQPAEQQQQPVEPTDAEVVEGEGGTFLINNFRLNLIILECFLTVFLQNLY